MIALVNIVYVAIGGALGSALRYCVGAYVFHLSPGSELPWGTVVVNLVGCFLIGALVEYSARSELLNKDLQLLLVTGFLGGFTTFSAFGLESVGLLNRSTVLAAVNILVSVGGGILAVYAGMQVLKTLLKA